MLPDASPAVEGALLACPICHGSLSPAVNELRCLRCAVGYTAEQGVIRAGPPFGDEPAAGSDLFAQERIAQLTAEAAVDGWGAAQARFAADVLGGRLPAPERSRWARVQAKLSGATWEDTLQDIVDPVGSGWKFLLDLRQTSRVCFLGPSWGAAPLSMARSCAHVVLLDGSISRLELARQQARGAGLENLTFARVTDPLRLPCADASMDLMIVPGLADWFDAVAGEHALPAACGAELFAEIKRVLGARGQVYVSMENRRGLSRVFGQRQPVGASFSPRALRDVLTAAGFQACELFSPFPFRHKFHQIIDVGRTDRMNFCADPYRTRGSLLRPLVKVWDRWNRNAGVERQLYPYLPGLSAVASPDGQAASFAERVLRRVGEGANLPASAWALSRYYVRAKGAVVLVGGEPAQVIVRVPMADSAAATCDVQHRAIETLAADERIPSELRQLFPAPLADGRFEGQTFFSEHAVSGEVGRLYYSLPEDRFDRAIENAAETLRQLRRATEVPTLIDEAEFRRHCGDWLTDLRKVVAEAHRSAFDDVERFLRDTLVGSTLPLGWYHGDYDFANLLYGPDDRVSGVLDFEVFDARGLPLIDFLVLLARRPIRQRAYAFGTLFTQVLLERKLPPLEAKLIEQELETLGLDESHYRALALCCWLNHLRLRRDSWLVRSPAWLDENLHTVIESVRRVLA
jgi:aminoglycoside phosphotransferase (APT) family kinase protein